MDRLTGPQGNECVLPQWFACRYLPVTFLQRDRLRIDRQAVKCRAVAAGEGFEFIQGVLLFEDLGV